jgi:fluoride exporter
MSAAILIGIAVAGGVGALGRFAFDASLASRVATSFPVGTLAVNLSGSVALGVLAGATLSEDALRVAATGLLGSYTTFSTWALESQRLGEEGRPGLAATNLALSLVAGIGFTWLGLGIGSLL